ncbi:TIM-barrel domain-containing protein [Lentisphaerota bacterium WC36G]|nr:DUF5110 domain-containing protein [Lentisphaerae bacterium WC36]
MIKKLFLTALCASSFASLNNLSAMQCETKGETTKGDLSDLQSVKKWEKLAPGIWKLTIGDMNDEIRYTDYAASKPKTTQLNKYEAKDFPFSQDEFKFMFTKDKKIVVRIPTDKKESLYGFGLQYDGIKKTKKVLQLNVDHWARGGGKTHGPVPFYISSRGYGVFFNTARFMKFYVQVGNRKDDKNLPPRVDRNPPADEPQPGRWDSQPISNAVEMSMNGNGLEVIVFAGDSVLDIVAKYNLLNGGGAMPPLWGLGFWHRVPSKFNEKQVRDEIAVFEKEGYPLDVLGLEPGWQTKSYPCTFEWQKKRFPNPGKFSQDLLNKGIRLNLWLNPYISPSSRIYEKMYPLSGSHMVWLGIVPDYNLPEARKILTDQHYEDHIKIGVSGYKVDEVDGYDKWLWPDHATFPSGKSAEAMRQSYGLLLENMYYNDLFKKRNVRTYGLIRANNGAASGYPFAIYSDSYNHKEYITGISAASLSGLLWAPEVRSAYNGKEWLNRMQTAAFSDFTMLNAWASGKKPWSYKDVAPQIKEVMQLRMSLLPYLYTAFSEYNRKGIPPVRAMVLEAGFDLKEKVIQTKLDGIKNPYETDKVMQKTDQYMFGPSILVAPFYGRCRDKREVVLPKGKWYDFYTGKFIGNGNSIKITNNGRTPLFVKNGAVIPMLTKPVVNTKEAYGHELKLRHYGKKTGTAYLYEDDGLTFDYESKDAHRLTKYTVSADGQLTKEVVTNKAKPMFGNVIKVEVMTK